MAAVRVAEVAALVATETPAGVPQLDPTAVRAMSGKQLLAWLVSPCVNISWGSGKNGRRLTPRFEMLDPPPMAL